MKHKGVWLHFFLSIIFSVVLVDLFLMCAPVIPSIFTKLFSMLLRILSIELANPFFKRLSVFLLILFSIVFLIVPTPSLGLGLALASVSSSSISGIIIIIIDIILVASRNLVFFTY
jgi:hypothetical protein